MKWIMLLLDILLGPDVNQEKRWFIVTALTFLLFGVVMLVAWIATSI